jgi:hypothetical protein
VVLAQSRRCFQCSRGFRGTAQIVEHGRTRAMRVRIVRC